MNKQTRIPLHEALVHYNSTNPISFHVPGHKSGAILNQQYQNTFQELLRIDATELSGLDDLHSPEGVIKEAEELLAALYQVKESFFLVNGSTVGNLAMILSVSEKDDVILVQRNCHKSVLNALKLAKVRPIFLEPEYNSDWRAATGVSKELVERAISLHPEAKGIVLTYPNYYGMVYDLKSVIDIAHRHNIPVLVDEAHGPHFIIGEPFPATAIQLGADIIVHSAHKTLPAMTMGSYLHINSDRVNSNKVREYLQMLQSSSPSYVIMASLDLARNYLATYQQNDLDYLQREISNFKKELLNIQSIKVLEYPNSHGDTLKVTIQSRSKLSGFELQKRFEEKGIYTELADPYNVLLILPLLKENHHYPLGEASRKIKELLKEIPYRPAEEEVLVSTGGMISELAIPYEELSKVESEVIPISQAAGQVCAETIIPYPPGIPLLLTGELITEEKVKQLAQLIDTGARFQGGSFLDRNQINIVRTSD
ncbi:aminotransferase class I/II-fold pyridoxal phosphate-dependent enzyme [Neobacillus niacini]|uniref:aminotransferase class I/II-fold pyridoxal phosphate-dependent enzyme n=1 Tax=Neobacillus niacini TaxID=86668 RepID=UPI00052F9504|nr:aminotransferase class I/II-fold pyridoxal phosphate-dependent enzyme [Neobacillus niacini]KGM45369.1 arginine decarboxylase [Neobacillus niacini]MEC1526100.1 aminotransferase class I/II-fold pyridoxal phosphate-dependent enzyme [Neobacillus niacini]